MTTKEIGKLIQTVRSDIQRLYDLNKISEASGSKEGLKCFNPEVLERMVNRTDREILEDLTKSGAVIDGMEEYLAQVQK